MGSYLTQFSRKCIFVFLFILSKESALSSFYITYVLASLYLNSRYISVIYKMKLPHVSTYECFAYPYPGMGFFSWGWVGRILGGGGGQIFFAKNGVKG